MSKVFVSYKRVDKDKVFPIVEELEKDFGINCWVDLAGIESDEQFSNVIVNAINQCEVFLFMYSKVHENIDPKDDWTVREIIFAAKKKKRIVFIDIDDYELPDWFAFRFPDQQLIKANDSRAMGKLADDMRNWLRLPLPNNQGKTIDTKDTYIRRPNHQSEKSDEINSHPQAIDLGLPSGTKWASCNVGATKPEEYGDYFAWGEIENKSDYGWSSYLHFEGREEGCSNLGSDIAGTKYDVAHKSWGDCWRMPTTEQFKELIDYCHHEKITLKGIEGLKLTSKFNGNSIFLPSTGFHMNSNLHEAGSSGHYWSSTQDPLCSIYAVCLYFDLGGIRMYNSSRFEGLSVRPVVRN